MDEQLGRTNYEGFCAGRGGVGFDGKPMPSWEALRPELKRAYTEGARAVLAQFGDLAGRATKDRAA
jgi:hypothetical protein